MSFFTLGLVFVCCWVFGLFVSVPCSLDLWFRFVFLGFSGFEVPDSPGFWFFGFGFWDL